MTSASGDINNIQSSLISGITRGGLLYPSEDMVYFALVSYLVTDKLIALKEFLNVPSQRLTAVSSIMAVLENEDRIGFYDAECGNCMPQIY